MDGDTGDVTERVHGLEWGPTEADGCGEPSTRTVEPARSEPPPECPAQPRPAAAAPLQLLPRAAGGGAGGVAALVMLADVQVREHHDAEPVTAPAEPPQAPSWANITPSPERVPPEPERFEVTEPAQAEQVEAPALVDRPQLPTPPSEPPAVDTAIGLPPALSTAEAMFEQAAVELVPSPLSAEPPAIDAADAKPPALREERLEPAAVEYARSPPPPVGLGAPPASARAWPEALSPPATETKVPARGYLRLALGLAAAGALALAGLVLALVVLYRWVDPPASALMLGQRLGGTAIIQRWVPLARISPNLHLAAIVSEDARFCRHAGVDWGELQEAIEAMSDGIARGGSTISMQVVKNLFLWPSRSYLRKAIEIPLAYVVEAAWSKPRILEIYLNIAEWGPGVFGAEAAARYHFRKPASLLSPREAALLAVSLPNPFERQAGSPGPGTLRLADNLLLRMRAAQGNAACVRTRPAGR